MFCKFLVGAVAILFVIGSSKPRCVSMALTYLFARKEHGQENIREMTKKLFG